MNFALSRDATNVLRGWAIMAVIGLHLLSMVSGVTQFSITSPVAVSLDQFFRFSVPLFFVLSGWSLQFSYGERQLNWLLFLKKRLTKLIPLYALWSVLSMIVFWVVPEWSFGVYAPNRIVQLLLGQADYQMYFWFVIVQFYVLFPVLKSIFGKLPHLTLIGSWLIQGGVLFAFEQFEFFQHLPVWLGMDRSQYIWSFAWLGYFTLGMWIARFGFPLRLRRWAWLATAIAGGLAVRDAFVALDQRIDPLLAFQFTRASVFWYGSLFGLAALLQAKKWTVDGVAKPLLIWRQLGKWSYLLFLNHLILLRLLVSSVAGTIDPGKSVVVTVLWLFGTGISIVLIKKGW